MTDNENNNDAFGKACVAAFKKLYCHRDHVAPVAVGAIIYFIGVGGHTVTTIVSVLAGVAIWQLMTRSPQGRTFRDNAARDRVLFPVRDKVRTSLAIAGVGEDLKVSVAYVDKSIEVEVVAPPGVADCAVTDRADTLASDLGAWKVTPLNSERHGVARLRVQMEDPLSGPLDAPWPLTALIKAGPLRSGDSVPVAMDETGRVVRILLLFSSLLISGLPRHGKSNALWQPMLHSAGDPAAFLIVVDLKGGMELDEISPRADIFCTDPDEALAALKWAKAEVDRRIKLLRGVARKITPGDPDFPAIWFFCDEMAVLYAGISREERQRAEEIQTLLVGLMSLAPAVGFIPVCATQRPSTESLGGSEARSRFSRKWAMRLGDSASAVMALGEAAIEKGADPVNLPPRESGGAGLGWMTDDTGGVLRCKSWEITDELIRELVPITVERRRAWLSEHAPPAPAPAPEPDDDAQFADEEEDVVPEWAPTNVDDLLDKLEEEAASPKPRRRRRRPTQKEDHHDRSV